MFRIKIEKSPQSAEKLSDNSNNPDRRRKRKLDLTRNPPAANDRIILIKHVAWPGVMARS
jgi:hypothetical protein